MTPHVRQVHPCPDGCGTWLDAKGCDANGTLHSCPPGPLDGDDLLAAARDAGDPDMGHVAQAAPASGHAPPDAPATTAMSGFDLLARAHGMVHHVYDDDPMDVVNQLGRTHQHGCTRCGWHNRPTANKPWSEQLATWHMEDCPRGDKALRRAATTPLPTRCPSCVSPGARCGQPGYCDYA